MSDNTILGADNAELVTQQVLDYISMANILPDAKWIEREVVAHGPGTHRKVAIFRGRAWDSTRKQHMFGGQLSESVQLIGEFEAESEIDGLVYTAPTAYLPMKWAKLMEEGVKSLPRGDDGKVAEGAWITMLLTLGCRATAEKANVRYTWTVQTHIDRAASPEMQRLRQLSRSPALQHSLPLQHPMEIEADTAA